MKKRKKAVVVFAAMSNSLEWHWYAWIGNVQIEGHGRPGRPYKNALSAKAAGRRWVRRPPLGCEARD